MGFRRFGVSTFALGIAMPVSSKNLYGLKPSEVTRQRFQLAHFVGSRNSSRVYNFGEEGFNLLPIVAGEISDQLETEIFGSDDEKSWWCGWTSISKCIGVPGVGTGQYCKWMNLDGNWPEGNYYACRDKGFCDWDEDTCLKDSTYCDWNGEKCTTKPAYVQYQ
jgi:hypothetical protein